MDHKNLDVWKESINLVKLVYKISEEIPKDEKFGLTQQIRRSAVSIPSNIAEGAGRKSDKEYRYFLSIARGSLAELDTQLYIAKEIFAINYKEEYDKIIVVGKLLSGLIKYLSNKNNIVKEPDCNYITNNNINNSSNQDMESSTNNSSFTNHHSQLTTHYFSHETAVIDEGAVIGEGTKIWHFSHIMTNCEIGEACNIGQNVVVSPDVKLGKNVKVQNNVSIYTGVICEDDVFLGPSMVFTNVINPRSNVIRKSEYQKTLVKKGATIGANATIVCGITIGEYGFIGAGAVVLKDVKPYALVVGNPSKQIGWMSEYGQRLNFDNDGIAYCPESEEKYILKDNIVIKE